MKTRIWPARRRIHDVGIGIDGSFPFLVGLKSSQGLRNVRIYIRWNFIEVIEITLIDETNSRFQNRRFRSWASFSFDVFGEYIRGRNEKNCPYFIPCIVRKFWAVVTRN